MVSCLVSVVSTSRTIAHRKNTFASTHPVFAKKALDSQSPQSSLPNDTTSLTSRRLRQGIGLHTTLLAPVKVLGLAEGSWWRANLSLTKQTSMAGQSTPSHSRLALTCARRHTCQDHDGWSLDHRLKHTHMVDLFA